MPKYSRPFRLALPSLRLPDTHGGKPAIVIASVAHPTDPAFCLAHCMDIDGAMRQNVPLPIGALHKAAHDDRIEFTEMAPGQVSPSGLILPAGVQG